MTASERMVPANQSSVTLTITPFCRRHGGRAETVTLTLNPNNAYLVGPSNAATVTIN